MSDSELEIVFENIVPDSELSSRQSNKDDIVCLSPGASVANIPKISVQEALRIKSETSEYLKQQIGKLRTKYNSQSRRERQLDKPTLKFKSVKYANGITKNDQYLSSVKDSSNVHDVSPITSNAKETNGSEVAAPKISPVTSHCTLDNDEKLPSAFFKTSSDDGRELNGSKLTTPFSVLSQSIQKNSNNKLNVSPQKSTNGGEGLNVSQETSHPLETPQWLQKNESIVHCVSSTDISGVSKDSKTSSPKQLKENNTITHNVSESSEQVKIQSSASLSSTQSKIKLSYGLTKRPNKFSVNGSPLSSSQNSRLYSLVKKSPRSMRQTSPLTFMRNKLSLSDARGVKRKLDFSNEINGSIETSEISANKNPQDDETESVTSISQMHSQYTDAYLLRQLKLHTDIVLEDSNSRNLINDTEMDIIRLFFDMNSECQDLYARMHNRKYKWNRLLDIQYNSATEENMHSLEEKGFLVTDLQNVNLADVLDLLKLPEIKGLCKSLGIKSGTQSKKNCTKEIINYCQCQKTIGFQLQVISSEEVVKQKIKNILGPCFVLSPEPRGLFRRIHLLFNLKFNRNEQSKYGSQDLFEIQFVGTEKALYPNCSIDRTAQIFPSREDLLKFQIAEDLKMDFFVVRDNKDWSKAETLLDTIRSNFICEFDFVSVFDDSTSRVSACDLPLSLRKFTPGSVYAYMLSEGVEVLKKMKKKDKAIDDLLLLLDQTTFLPYMRGRWYEKLIVLHRTSGQHKEVAKTIRAGMSDPHVDDQSSYVMSCRSRELMKKKLKGLDREIKLMLVDIPLFPELESVERTEIRARALDGKSGYKRVYIQDDETGDGKNYSSVEEFVKSHYCPRIFKHGMHAENSLVSSLFGILFWDLIYEYHVPCAFISPFQTRPLDLSTGEFYKNRQNAIDAKLAKLSEWTDDDVSAWVTDVYNKHYSKTSIVYWKWFSNSADIVNIVNCIGLEVLLKICERYAKKYRGVRSGFPDLFLWTPGEKKQYKFVEVKGPNDTLGTNQKLWLDFLVKINANVEVCSVIAQGSKPVNTTCALEPTATCKDNAAIEEY